MRNAIIAIIVLVLIGLGAWYWSSTTAAPSTALTAATSTPALASSTPTSSSAGASPNTGTRGNPTTLAAVANQSGNFTCSITVVTSSGQSTGTVYGAGGKVRIDFVAPTQNGNVTAHIIRNGGYSYTWVDGEQSGTKTAITAGSPVVPPQGGVVGVTDSGNVSSDCHPWSPDQTQFTPPSGISFVAR